MIAWHRKSFRLFWTWKVRRGQPGRPAVPKDVRELIRRLSRENVLWGAPRIHGELLKLGIDIGETRVGKYMPRHRQPPSQTWRTFLENHVKTMVSVDFFTVPTIRFQVLYVLLVLAHDRRRIVHFNVTAHPMAEWTVQQMREAFPFDQIPRYLLRDRDGIFGSEFRKDVKAMGITEVLSAPRSPWQCAYVERVIGRIRREYLDHVIVFGEASLYQQLKLFLSYYHESRTHLALAKDPPKPQPVHTPERGRVVAIRQVGGLHHRYDRRAARSLARTPPSEGEWTQTGTARQSRPRRLGSMSRRPGATRLLKAGINLTVPSIFNPQHYIGSGILAFTEFTIPTGFSLFNLPPFEHEQVRVAPDKI